MKRFDSFKRAAALLLALALLLTLFTGCAKKDGSNKDGQSGTSDKSDSSGSKNDNKGSQTDSELAYKAKFTSLPEELNDVWMMDYAKGTVYFVSQIVTGARRSYYDANWMLIGSVEIDPSELPDEDGGGMILYDTRTGDATAEVETEEDGGEEEEVQTKYDENGNLLTYEPELDIWYMYASNERVYEPALCKISIDGTGYTVLPDYKASAVPEGKEGSFEINYIKAVPDGSLWLIENGSFSHMEGDEYIYDGSQSYILHVSSTGKELARIDLQKYQSGDYSNFSNLSIDDAGYIYIADGSSNMILIFDGTGKLINNIEMGEHWVNYIMVIKGVAYAAYYSQNGQVMTALDPVKATTGEEIPLGNNMYSLIPSASDKYDFYYQDSNNVCGYNLSSGVSEPIFNWIDVDVNSNNVRSIIELEDGSIAAFSEDYSNYSGDSVWELVTFTQVPASEIPQKITLSLAAFYIDYDVRNAIINFNKTNDTYRIRATDYSAFNTEDDYNAGLTKLSTEIISGDIPDIILTAGLPISTYQKKGLIEDLTPYLKNDSELKDDILYDAFKPLLAEDGTLPAIARGFSISTLAGASSIVGDKPGWTLRDMDQALALMPQGTKYLPETTLRGEIIDQFCRMMLSDFIDLTTGQCSFDSQDFKDILIFASKFPESIDWDNYYEDINWDTESEDAQVFYGKVMLSRQHLSDLWNVNSLKAMFHDQPFTYIGYPTSKSNGSVVEYDVLMSMSSSCKNKDGAWEFMRTILTPEYQQNYGWTLCTNKTVFDNMVKEEMQVNTYIDENGQEVAYPNTAYIGGQEIEVSRLSQADVDQILALLDGAKASIYSDDDVLNIITEEAAAFFSGQKSVDDVCAIIQSRVKIYINERM